MSPNFIALLYLAFQFLFLIMGVEGIIHEEYEWIVLTPTIAMIIWFIFDMKIGLLGHILNVWQTKYKR